MESDFRRQCTRQLEDSGLEAARLSRANSPGFNWQLQYGVRSREKVVSVTDDSQTAQLPLIIIPLRKQGCPQMVPGPSTSPVQEKALNVGYSAKRSTVLVLRNVPGSKIFGRTRTPHAGSSVCTSVPGAVPKSGRARGNQASVNRADS
ncbi:hypothetical protein VFPPC_01062 [Pochonia chlamydosporia 170]|uniref:Uncharacterized protein n=1 Tax=Pochonia chlamydosporia 170 TaxID=1380566 RepID=A0A179G679_METCM|nr:hypothetical protein VFPPC_01062 [Pochonia chlamydosporia 170]OAQ73326.2 hypothetical protein VFPPC_01062 [Pochonia chlamydosporia 170]